MREAQGENDQDDNNNSAGQDLDGLGGHCQCPVPSLDEEEQGFEDDQELDYPLDGDNLDGPLDEDPDALLFKDAFEGMYLSIPLLLTSYDTISGDGSDDEHRQSQRRSNEDDDNDDDPAGVVAGRDNDVDDMDVDLPSNHVGISPLLYIHIILQLA